MVTPSRFTSDNRFILVLDAATFGMQYETEMTFKVVSVFFILSNRGKGICESKKVSE